MVLATAAPSASAPPTSAPPVPVGTLLARGAAQVASDPRGAVATFTEIRGNPIADAYLAYLALDAGDSAGAVEAVQRARQNLDPTERSLAELKGPAPTVEEALRILRLGLEEAIRSTPDEPPLSCSVFVRHGPEATPAFGALWGSTRDMHGRDLKELCLAQFLQAMPGDDAARVHQALQDTFAAIRTVAPQPEGTMYDGVFIGDTDVLLDVLLAPESPMPTVRVPLDRAIALAAKREPALAVRARAFGPVRKRVVPELAAGICAILTARQRAADPAACTQRAEAAVTQALSEWLEGRRSMMQ